MVKIGYIKPSTHANTIDTAMGDIEAIKRLASAVIIQAKNDYERGLLTKAALHKFCQDSWVWDVLEVDSESIERGIVNDN